MLHSTIVSYADCSSAIRFLPPRDDFNFPSWSIILSAAPTNFLTILWRASCHCQTSPSSIIIVQRHHPLTLTLSSSCSNFWNAESCPVRSCRIWETLRRWWRTCLKPQSSLKIKRTDIQVTKEPYRTQFARWSWRLSRALTWLSTLVQPCLHMSCNRRLQAEVGMSMVHYLGRISSPFKYMVMFILVCDA